MECVSSLQSYLARPVGRYFCGPSYIVWWKSARLNGIVLWGRPEEAELACITRALDAELAPGVLSHASLIDARRVWGVDAAAFNTLLRYVASRREPFSRLVLRQALLRPEGLVGAVIAGFYSVLTPSYPVQVFTDARSAIDWLEVPDEARTIDELDAIVERMCGSSSTVAQVRVVIEGSLSSATVERTADTMRLSTRSLQRRLREAGTSFRAELNLAQVRIAKALMLDSSLDLKRIAREVGCASPQNFSSLFKKLEGASPREWRFQRV